MSTPDRNVWRSELRRGGLWAIPQLVVLLVALVTSPPAPKGEGLDTLKTAGGPAESGGAKEAEPPRTPQAGPAEASAVQDQWSGKKNIDRLLRGRWFALRTPRSGGAPFGPTGAACNSPDGRTNQRFTMSDNTRTARTLR